MRLVGQSQTSTTRETDTSARPEELAATHRLAEPAAAQPQHHAGVDQHLHQLRHLLMDLHHAKPATHHEKAVAERRHQGVEAAHLAESKLGQQAQNVHLRNYTHAGGRTNDCADFVSALLADKEHFHKRPQDASVTSFEGDLKAQGWHKVSKQHTHPGDVAILLGNGIQHTELVAKKGAASNIGANGSRQETIGRDDLNWAGGITTFYTRD